MDVVTIGAGPGGLYTSLLLKKDHPEWDVTVYERNPPDVTYGWGIVFPNRTLSNLQEADPESHETITETVTRWEPFDLHFKGRTYRSSGHSFASMLRTDLLSIIQDRCMEVGVDVVFETEIETPPTVARDADLLVGADGIYSETRQAFADEFQAETIDGTARFSWFGTEADFDVLSHIFVENDDGIWCAHTYPGPVSTFIVDCDAVTWQNSGLEDMTEDTYRAYLEDLFADHLDGHELLSQQDRWRTFSTVRNGTWHYDNVVLIGDAAHTAHYSIGSGTTMAMEDAISLASSFRDGRRDVGSALSAFEAERRPVAESLQRAGERSRLHFEHIRRFFDLEGIQFVLHHLTRSGRLSYQSMARRDADLVEEFERWFAATAQGVSIDSVGDPDPPYAQPLDLRQLRIPCRTVSAGELTYSSSDGLPGNAHIEEFRTRVERNPGLSLTEPLAVSADGRITPGSPGLYRSDHEVAWRRAVESVDGPTGTHLYHAGERGAVQPRTFALDRPVPRNESWAPRLADQYERRPASYTPDRMDRADRQRVANSFVEAARRADYAGFDYLQLHLGNGYLLASYLSPITNRREDELGGGIQGRAQFPLKVVSEVREVWPDEKPLAATLQVVDWAEDGLTMEESLAVGRRLEDAGVDILVPTAGGITSMETPDDVYGLANYSDQFRNELEVPTVASVLATTADEVNTLVATGRADLCTYYGSFEALY